MTQKKFLMEMHGLVEDLMFVARRYEEEADSLEMVHQKADMYGKSDGVMKAVQVIRDRGWA